MRVNKIDSNVTGLRYAEEVRIGVLPDDPIWNPLEPNSYNNFGGEVSTAARETINASRQRQKGSVVDLDASGGIGHDLTYLGFQELLQGFCFADFRVKAEAMLEELAVSSDGVFSAPGIDGQFGVNDILAVRGAKFRRSGYQGRVVEGSAAGELTTSGAEVAAVNGQATIAKVGHRFPAGDLSMQTNGPEVYLETAQTDLLDLNLTPGEFVFIGGDSAATAFEHDGNNRWARVQSVTADRVYLDKTSGGVQAEDGDGLTVQMYFGRVLKNEKDPALIKRRTYSLERTLGSPDSRSSSQQSEYLTGSVPGELSMSFDQASKITADLNFMSIDHETRTAEQGLKRGARPQIVGGEALNTSTDFSRLRIAEVPDDGNSNPETLFAFMTQFDVSINNNLSANKGVGELGAFDMTAGTFEVGGSLTAYFASVEAVEAVRHNADVTLDLALMRDNQGVAIDLPWISLGSGRLEVTSNEPITLPLEAQAAEHPIFGHTICMSFFDYLPDAAA